MRVVFCKVGDAVKLIRVEVGIADDNYVSVLSGLKGGEQVVAGSYTAISRELKQDAKVTIEKPKDEDGK